MKNSVNNKHINTVVSLHESHNMQKILWTPEGRVCVEKKYMRRPFCWLIHDSNIKDSVYGHDRALNGMLIMGTFYFKQNKPWNGCNKFTENRPAETNDVNTWKEQELSEFDNRLCNHIYSSRKFWLFQIHKYRGIWRKVQSQKLLSLILIMNSSLAQNYSNIDQVNAFLTRSVWERHLWL